MSNTDNTLIIRHALIDNYNRYAEGLDSKTRHTITNHRVSISGEQVSCRAYLRADHVIFANPDMPAIGPEEMVTVVGEYTNHYTQLDGVWKICKSELLVNWSEGNISLLATATERALTYKGA